MAKAQTTAKTTAKRCAPILVAEELASDAKQEGYSAAAREYAVRLAHRLGTSIDLLHVEDIVLYPAHAPEYKPMIDAYYAERKSTLEIVAKTLPVPTRPVFLLGAPARKLRALAEKKGGYEMLAMGTHGRKGLPRLMLGSVADEAIRHSRIPVMVAGPRTHDGISRFLKAAPTILIPTDLTENSKRAEAYGLSLAKKLGAEIVLFHSLRDTLHPVIQTAFALPDSSRRLSGLVERLSVDAQKALGKKAARLSRHGVITTAVLEDQSVSASAAILKEIPKSSVSLIVMGTHGRSSVSGAFFGRTARDVILESSVPVIAVRA